MIIEEFVLSASLIMSGVTEFKNIQTPGHYVLRHSCDLNSKEDQKYIQSLYQILNTYIQLIPSFFPARLHRQCVIHRIARLSWVKLNREIGGNSSSSNRIQSRRLES